MFNHYSTIVFERASSLLIVQDVSLFTTALYTIKGLDNFKNYGIIRKNKRRWVYEKGAN
jgi:hypothetical protein